METENLPGYTAEMTPRRPVLAILTMSDAKLGFRGNRENFADLVRTGKGMDFTVYVLCCKHLNLTQSTLTGYTTNEKTGEWERGQFPFPTSSTTGFHSGLMSSGRSCAAS